MATVSRRLRPSAPPSRWELAAAGIAVKIRWFGLLVGFLIVNVQDPLAEHRAVLNALLALGVLYTLCDTYHSLRGRVFLGRHPLATSALEAVFIGLLCYFHGGLESTFRFYYLLSLICCAIRQPSRITYATWALHAAGYGLLYVALPEGQRRPLALVLTLVILAWVTWASDALSLLLKRVGEHLSRLNEALQENQAQLEERIAERTRELQEAQARLLHQEKMAAFGLLAAGIAHEVGNPLTSVSSLVQLLQRREAGAYSQEKLALISGQLQRIQGILRELTNFSRPASDERARVGLGEILEEAVNITKYYKRTKGRLLSPHLPADLPPLFGVRDQLVQVFLNLILNAVDATERGGHIDLRAERQGGEVVVTVEDDGAGIPPAQAGRVFQPYFTTKKHGTGLGLFVTHKLVTEHGGSVEFDSRPGGGTLFRVRLPVADRQTRIQGDRETRREVEPVERIS